MKLKSKDEIVENKVTTISENNILPPAQSPYQMAIQAVKDGASVEVLNFLKEAWKFDKDVKAQQAKEAHFQAMAKFYEEAPPLKKDMVNKQFGSKYTSIGLMLKTYMPYLGKHGLRIRFGDINIKDNEMFLECFVSHALGYEEKTPASLPLVQPAVGKTSGKAAMNPTQAIKATFTYLRSMVVEAALGVAGSDATLETDGNVPEEYVNDQQYADILSLLQELEKSEQSFCRYKGVDSLDKLPANQYEETIKELEGWRR